MALPNDKISTTLVANTLGTSSRDVGTLCTHQAINKWSKWKPVRFNTNGNPLTDANRISVTSDMLIGLKGDAFTYDDFTPEQIEDLKRPLN